MPFEPTIASIQSGPLFARRRSAIKTESGSFRPWVVSAGSFRPGSFRPNFGVSRFGLFWWVVSAVSRFGQVCMLGGGNTLIFSAYVGFDPASTAYP